MRQPFKVRNIIRRDGEFAGGYGTQVVKIESLVQVLVLFRTESEGVFLSFFFFLLLGLLQLLLFRHNVFVREVEKVVNEEVVASDAV